MKSATRDTFRIDRVEQIRALAAPTRQEIVDALEISGPTTVAALGAMLHRAPDSLYHHIKILLRVGLIRKVKTRPTAFTRQAVYGLPGRRMRMVYDLENRVTTEAVNAVVRSMSRISYRDFERATNRGEATVDGPRRNLRGARMKGMLDAAQIKEINRLYERIVAIMAAPPRDRGQAKLHAITFLMSPLPGNRHVGARGRGQGKRRRRKA
jgi:DNA-binding transcriptional ArsR family regulator